MLLFRCPPNSVPQKIYTEGVRENVKNYNTASEKKKGQNTLETKYTKKNFFVHKCSFYL